MKTSTIDARIQKASKSIAAALKLIKEHKDSLVDAYEGQDFEGLPTCDKEGLAMQFESLDVMLSNLSDDIKHTVMRSFSERLDYKWVSSVLPKDEYLTAGKHDEILHGIFLHARKRGFFGKISYADVAEVINFHFEI